MGRRIAHLDMDAFYVNVELQRRPELRRKPVVVAGPGRRAVVTTASYEARRFGVVSATPAERARRLCPEAVFVPPDFPLYRARSRQVMEVVARHVERVEAVGLDEAYLDLSALERPRTAARRLKASVTEATGLSCSMGLGPSKLVAKVASDADKPDGFLELTREEARMRFATASHGLIPGIGPRTVERLRVNGIGTLGALAAAEEGRLSALFGARLGPQLRRLARFEDDRPVEDARRAKSESRETTFDRDLVGVDALIPVLDRLGAELCHTLRRQGRLGRTVAIKVRFSDFTTRTRARSIDEPVNDAGLVGGLAQELLRGLVQEFRESGRPFPPVRLLGVRVARLEERGEEPSPRSSLAQLSLSV